MTPSMSGWAPQARQIGPVVVGQPLLGHAFELEQQHVPRLLALGVTGGDERGGVAHRQRHQVVDAVGQQRAERPRQRGTPVVAHDVGALDAQGVEDGHHVSGQVRDGVGLHLRGLVRGTVSPQIGNHGGEPGVDEGGDLVAPQAAAVGETVQEDDGWPLSRHLVLDAHTTHVDAHHVPLLPGARKGSIGLKP